MRVAFFLFAHLVGVGGCSDSERPRSGAAAEDWDEERAARHVEDAGDSRARKPSPSPDPKRELLKLAFPETGAIGDAVPLPGKREAGLLVLPGEVVSGERFRFEAPASFLRIDHPRHAVRGRADGTELTLWAERESYGGSLDALIERERADARDARATVEDLGAVPVLVAGKRDALRSHSLVLGFSHWVELQVMVIYGPAAYLFHCRVPAGGSARKAIDGTCRRILETWSVATPGE